MGFFIQKKSKLCLSRRQNYDDIPQKNENGYIYAGTMRG